MTARSMGYVGDISTTQTSQGPRYFGIEFVNFRNTVNKYKMRGWSLTLENYVCWITTNPNANAPTNFGNVQNKCIAEVLTEYVK